MKVIGFEDIKALQISPAQCYAWVSEMIEKKGMAVLPPKAHMNLPGNIFCNVMPSILKLPDAEMGGVKIVTRYPKRTPALDSRILLFDASSGEFLALMDGSWITAMRTGAVAAHSVLQFARPGFSSIGMMGLGNTARAALLVLAEMLPEKELHIRLLSYKDQAESFMNRFSDFKNLHFSVVETPSETVKGSDVVISCVTYFEDDICPDSCFDEGVLVVPVHTRGFTNCDLFFDKVFVDDIGHVDHFKNFGKFRYCAEVSDVVNRRSPGREHADERILAYNIGVSLHDVFYASRLYQALKGREERFRALPEADLQEPVEKFWV